MDINDLLIALWEEHPLTVAQRKQYDSTIGILRDALQQSVSLLERNNRLLQEKSQEIQVVNGLMYDLAIFMSDPSFPAEAKERLSIAVARMRLTLEHPEVQEDGNRTTAKPES